MKRLRLVLHICCATCAAFVLEQLRANYDVTALYYNPNIYPTKEYAIRCDEARTWCDKKMIPFVELAPDQRRWFEVTRGHESDPERGERCTICYRLRLEQTVRYARENNFQIFGTDLSISPHKDAARLNTIGRALAAEYGVAYLSADFKKRDGFKKAMTISRAECFYRQDYCGCIYSLQARQASK